MVTKVLVIVALVGAFGIISPAQAAEAPNATGVITISGATGSLAGN